MENTLSLTLPSHLQGVCNTNPQSGNNEDVFIALEDLVNGKLLQQPHDNSISHSEFLISVFWFIHGSGWIHWDVSLTNVYIYKGCALLGDLKYAKRTDDQLHHEVWIVSEAFACQYPSPSLLKNCNSLQLTSWLKKWYCGNTLCLTKNDVH